MSGPAQEPDSGAESLSSDEKEVTPNGMEGSGSGSAEEQPEGEASSEDSSSSSSEEESDEEQEEKESPPYCNESEENFLPPCEHCRNENDQKEQVTPRRLAGGQFMVQLDAEGSYQCSITGLIFEVTGAARITYSLLSWSKYAHLVEKPWIVGGPLFDVRCSVPAVLSSLQFPHCLCLQDQGAGVAFKLLHVKAGGAAIEPSAEFSASHVRWVVTSLSPVGPLIQSQQPLQYHGAVILYKAVDEHPSLSFWVYLATNNDSFIKDISKAVKHSKRKFVKIEKPAVCQKLLQEGKKYRLICEPEAEITPVEIEFVDGSLLKLKSYFEVYLEKPDDFTLSLVEQDSDETVWKAKLRERDWIHCGQNMNEQRRSTASVKKRKPALSILEEEELHFKKQKNWQHCRWNGSKVLNRPAAAGDCQAAGQALEGSCHRVPAGGDEGHRGHQGHGGGGDHAEIPGAEEVERQGAGPWNCRGSAEEPWGKSHLRDPAGTARFLSSELSQGRRRRKRRRRWELPSPTILLLWDPAGIQEYSPLSRKFRQDPPEKQEWNFMWIKATSKTSRRGGSWNFALTPRESHKHWKKPLGLFHQREKDFYFHQGKKKQGEEFPWKLSSPSQKH